MGSSKERAAERALQWWSAGAQVNVANCDKCNVTIYHNGGYLSAPIVGVLGNTPDLLCGSCYDESDRARPFEGAIVARETRVTAIKTETSPRMPDFRPTPAAMRRRVSGEVTFGLIVSIIAGVAVYCLIAVVAGFMGYSLWSLRLLLLIGLPNAHTRSDSHLPIDNQRQFSSEARSNKRPQPTARR